MLIIEAKFDKEYSTQWIAEKNWLSEHGIKYSFVKQVNGIDTYKYKKTLKLFQCLTDFYSSIYYKD